MLSIARTESRNHRVIMILTLMITTTVGCNANRQNVVRSWGTMREVLAEGKRHARVRISDVATADTYAVGALEHLAGEITIYNGECWFAQDIDGELVTEIREPQDEQATLLALSVVEHWQSSLIKKVGDRTQLEDYIEGAAIAAGLDLAQPFPFTIVGKLDAKGHVINGGCPYADESSSPHYIDIEGDAIIVVGIFAKNHAGKLTHHGRRTHMHTIRKESPIAMAHLDDILTGQELILHLPANATNHTR